MEKSTKERILEEALKLFAQSGYSGTSMKDIAQRLGITKAALYKHYTGKQEILQRITERMSQMDLEHAQEYEMPEVPLEEDQEAYEHVPADKIRTYTKAMFRHWTEESFSSDFRKMLTLEQYRDPEMARLYRMYLASGPVEYMTDIFRPMTDSDETAGRLALQFYGPVFLLYTVYDETEEKESVIRMLDRHMEHFFRFTLSQNTQESGKKQCIWKSTDGTTVFVPWPHPMRD